MYRWASFVLLFICLILNSTPSLAKPFTMNEIPKPLQAWVPFLLYDIEHNSCPFYYNNPENKICIWPTSLNLQLSTTGGEFSYAVTVYEQPDQKPQAITLPGDADSWPQQVKISKDKQNIPAIVVSNNELPTLLLSAGNYHISGEFLWDELPMGLEIPENIGVVELALNDKPVEALDIEENKLWLQREHVNNVASQTDKVDVKIFRKVTDDIPLWLDTNLQLQVSGKQREEILGKILPEGFQATSINSDIPVRLEKDGTLRAQLRAGTWNIRIGARYADPVDNKLVLVNKLKMPKADNNGYLPKQEIWTYEAKNQLRLTQIEGVPTIDASQLELPHEWKNLPAYLLHENDIFSVSEKKRGMAEGTPDQLTLLREIWMDFSGKGYSFKDTINGNIRSSSRLEVADKVQLGDVSINGKSQYVTTTGKDKSAGIEVREGEINLVAGSRIDAGDKKFFASGWKHNFDNASARLYLPPGWKLFHFSGVDSASPSWVGQWTLLDLFFVLVCAVSIYKLFGIRAGAVGLLCLVLAQHELPSFTRIILFILFTIAILRYLPAGKFRKIISWLQWINIAWVASLFLVFSVEHIRNAIYPQLAYSGIVTPQTMGGMVNQPMSPARINQTKKERRLAENDAGVVSSAAPAMSSDYASSASGEGQEKLLEKTARIIENYENYAPDTQIQTGFGNASWTDNAIFLQWNGELNASTSLSLWLLSAKQNLLLAFLRVGLMAWLLLLLLGIKVPSVKNLSKFSYTILIVAATQFMFIDNAEASQKIDNLPQISPANTVGSTEPVTTSILFPPADLLNDLKQKLQNSINEPPTCLPECATLARMQVNIADDVLTINQEVHVADNVALPLPGKNSFWRPNIVLVNGELRPLLMQAENGYLYVNLHKGVYNIKMSGSLPSGRENAAIALPLLSHHTSISAEGWDVEGDGRKSNSLNFTRNTKQIIRDEEVLKKTDITPFFKVERQINLAQQWKVNTKIQRLTPASEPVSVNIPLLTGETITSSGISVKNNEAFVNFGIGVSEVNWQSIMSPISAINLQASSNPNWAEIWQVKASNLWHVEFSGIPRIYEANNLLQWQPWAGEKVNLQIIRPQGVAGDTRTLDSSNLEVTLGQRSADMKISLNIRSSMGGQHEVTLPEAAVLSQVQRNLPNGGVEILPLQLKQNILSLPLIPGVNNFVISWKQNQELPLAYKTPIIKHGVNRSVNANINITMPSNRWILFVNGPQMGPAVLFWSWIPIILGVAFALSKFSITPLRFRHWFLLLLGLSQTALAANAMIIMWLLALGWRGKSEYKELKEWKFNLLQAGLIFLSLIVFSLFLESIRTGLLGTPDMRIMGGGSYGNQLRWYADITSDIMPQPFILSISIWGYRILMLLWSLWLAFSLVKWCGWGWKNFTLGDYWRSTPKPAKIIPTENNGES